MILIGGYLGGTAVADVANTVDDAFAIVPGLIGEFLLHSTYIIVIGICVILSGRAVRWFFERDLRLWRTIVIIVAVAWSSVMFAEAAQILIDPEAIYNNTLVYAIVGGIPVIVSTFFTMLLLRRKYSSYFKAPKEAMEDFEDSERDDQLDA